MISEYWMLAAWLTKVALYLSIAFVIGGAFCYVLLGRYVEIKKRDLKVENAKGIQLLKKRLSSSAR